MHSVTFTASWDSQASAADSFRGTLWREPCAGTAKGTTLYLRIVPTRGRPFNCSSAFSIAQAGAQYDVKITQSAGGSSFCQDLPTPTTFIVDQWSFDPPFDRDAAFTLWITGVGEKHQIAFPAYTAATPTTTTLATDGTPAMLGTPVAFTATVTGSAPTGGVTFAEGGLPLPGCSAIALAGSGNTRTAVCRTNALPGGNHGIAARYAGDVLNPGSSSPTLLQAITAPPLRTIWLDDRLPVGAVQEGTGEGWNWISTNPAPLSGALAHQSALAPGLHQHYFLGATYPLPIEVNDRLYAYVYLDAANPPTEVMLQWHDGAGWEHRAYWGANSVGWGVDGTASRRHMGPLPAAGKWVRLVVPAAQVGLEGKSVGGMAFTLYDGRATWDHAGK